MLSQLLCEFAEQHPELHVALSVFDTQTVVERVADRTLELGVVGAAPRHRGVEYEPFFRDTVIARLPARPSRSPVARSRSTSCAARR